jgi:hypothetical protein
VFFYTSYAQPYTSKAYPTGNYIFCGKELPKKFSYLIEKKTGTNYIEQLPPVNPTSGTRIGYFTTDENLLPFRTDTPNILY